MSILNETLRTITEAAKMIPCRPGVSTVWRWVGPRGCHGVVLESILVGGKRYTSDEAIERFVARLTAAANGEKSTATARTTKQRQRDYARDDSELAAAGI